MTHILFTGHMIDAPNRPVARFPAYKEEVAQKAIFNWLKACQKEYRYLKGISSAASGGDILFLEACIRLNIAAEIYLAAPVEEFKKASVSFAGTDWTKRFDKLISTTPYHILNSNQKSKENIWEQTNDMMLQKALASGNFILLALWDTNKGDGRGGTACMVEKAKKAGGKIDVINITAL